ncbi:DUF692 family multinuclear iron-containing protein [Vulgatibacter sp.]|uniref:multinuclear nonheme iron-dependent oxidase n=1 Tax=Vulgatibacter sp. TaxID=1971226 RepID=UPI003569C37C
METLPWMGLGLSTNLGPRDRPDPWLLHDTAPGLFDFVEYSAPLRIEEARAQAARFSALWDRRAELPAIFHPVHLNLWGPALESEENLAALAEHLRAIGSPWVGNDVGWWHHRDAPFPGYLYVVPPLTRAAVAQCAAHAVHVQAAIDVPLLLENPAVLFRNGDLHVLDFMAALHRETGAPLLLDLGHLLAYQLVHGHEPGTGLDGFPLDRVAEIHIAGGVITARGERRFYVDDHGQPVREELFAMLEGILPRCTGLKALTFEADGHPEPVARQTLQRLRSLVPALAPSPSEAPGEHRGPVVIQPGVLAEAERDAWALFDLVHAERGSTGDPEGVRADADFRLAVIAQQLDREWPLTRALAAGDREALQAFAASAEYRSRYEGTGKDLGAVFAAWARRRIRESRIAGGEVALAFESWCHGLLHRAAGALQEGAIALAPGIAAGTFPADLSELVFAARALRRHLVDRAVASGLYEASGLDALGQAAVRAQPGAWPVLVRRREGALEVEPIDASLLRLLRLAGTGAVPEGLAPADRATLERAVAAGLLRVGAA